MNIAALLVNPAPEAPRNAPSNSHHAASPSPAASHSKLPMTPPQSTPKHIPLRRNEPKPIWAYKEHEILDGQDLEQYQQRQQSQPPPSTPRSQPQHHPPPQMSPDVQSNGLGPPASRELQGFERPITDDPHVYDEIVRKVCDFIWNNVIENGDLRAAIAESPQTQVEIEARWGQIQYRQDGVRIHGIHETECVLRSQVSTQTKFESTMSLEQHKKMNNFLNNHVQLSKRLGGMRADIDYKHIKEIDLFYELDQEGFSQLPPLTQRMVGQSQTRQRIRITRDARTGNILRQIIKHRIANLEISSPSNEWDYRIGINLEIQFPGSIQNLTPVIEGSKTIEEMQRKKDRMSYSWLGAFQIDLTQVIQGSLKNHELELEVNADRLIEAADKIKKGEPNEFEALIGGMMNNLRILSREMTPQG